MRSNRLDTLAAAFAVASSASPLLADREVPKQEKVEVLFDRRRRRNEPSPAYAKRMEIAEWNAKVEAKKRAKGKKR